MSMALSGVKVLDLTQVMAGPFCCQVLGDLGADVVKVEPVGVGDVTRGGMGTLLSGGESSAFLAVNRNKRSITIDLKTEAGRGVLHRLAADADILVENFRPGVTGRLGVDYETMRRINPGLVYASISGFGQTGPYAARPGFDLIAQAMSGVMTVNGEPGSEPLKTGIPIADLSAGLFCAIGILSAYIARRTTGEGQYVDVSLFDSALALSIWETAELWATGEVPRAVGSAHRMSAPYQRLRTADGFLVLGANSPRLWRGLCDALDREDLWDDERFAGNAERLRNRDELAAELEKTLAERGTDEWVDLLLAAGVPAGPIRDYREVCEDPHTQAREMVLTMQHPVEGEVRGLGIPIKLSGTPGGIRRPAPLLGEHTAELLAEAGFTPDECRDLFEGGGVR